MRIGIHQPESIPYPGFFNKMMNSDIFVILDNVQFKKNNFQNRNRIWNNGLKWLTIPVILEGHMTSTIRDMKISDTVDWRTRNLNQIEGAYRKSIYYDSIMPIIREIHKYSGDSLFEFNMTFIKYFKELLDIETEIVFSSDLHVNSHKSDLVLDICESLNADTYLCGSGGRDYLDKEKFKEKGIEVLYQSMTPVGKDESQSTLKDPYLSTLDLLMNHYPVAAKYYIYHAYEFEE